MNTLDWILVPLGNLNSDWRNEYRGNRYLVSFTQEELNQRAGDLVTNLCTLTPEGKIGLKDLTGDGGGLARRFTHVLEEMQLRFGPYPAGFSDNVLAAMQPPKPTYPEVPRGYLALSSASLTRGRFLLKFGRATHLEPMLERGLVRISPASSYVDSSLNPAIRDDELSFTTIASPSQFRLEVLDPTGGPSVPVAGTRLTYTMRMKQDYFVFCMTSAADHRLFGDFGYNACLVIREPRDFLTRLVRAVKVARPSLQSGGGPLTYLDPALARPDEVSIPMTKHFRHHYQYEYRVFWMASSAPEEHLTHFSVELGDLSDIATLIRL